MLADIHDAMRRGDFAAALATARATLAAEPDNAAVIHLQGVCLQRTGDLAGARASFERALELAPDVASHHFSLASVRLALGDQEAGVQGLKQALELDPNQLGGYVMLAHLAVARRDLAEAERNLRLAQRVDPEHPQVRVIQGYVAQAQGDADKALKCFTAAAEADPNLAAAQLALGQAYLARGMWPFAEKALDNALRLDPSRAPTTLRALVEARRRQGKAPETLAALDQLLAVAPNDVMARVLRAELLGTQGQDARALADLLAVLDLQPAAPGVLRRAAGRLAVAGRGAEAIARVEAGLAADPRSDEAWRTRLELATLAGEDLLPVLGRWLAALPDSATCLEMHATHFEAQGDEKQAEAYADQALARQPENYGASLVKLRLELAREPEAALARADRLLAVATAPGVKFVLTGWRGLALDALGRHEEAAATWRGRMGLPVLHQVPPPPVLPAREIAPGQVEGRFLWSVPGLNVEALLRRIAAQLGPRVRLDRTSAQASNDGFGRLRFPPGHAEAGTAARWTAAVEAAGLAPAEAVDWIPHVDPWTFATLDGGRWLALLADPRDAFLNWLVRGSVQGYQCLPPATAAANWLAASLESLLAHQAAHPDKVELVRLDADPGEAASRIEKALGLGEPLPALYGRAPRFESGHWRAYAKVFEAEFARLGEVAVRLGYPAD